VAEDKVTVTELLKQKLAKRTDKECFYCGHKLIIEIASDGEGSCYFCPTCLRRCER
jgi:hypothetical protein